MDAIEITAIVGTCSRERSAFAEELAALTGGTLWSASQLGQAPDPISAATSFLSRRHAPEVDHATHAVMEFPASAPVDELIGNLLTFNEGGALRRLVCVVDASHLVADLESQAYLPVHPDCGNAKHTGLAAVTVTQIEQATHLALTNTEQLSPDRLATITGLLTALSPQAKLVVDPSLITDDEIPLTTYSERPGWVHLLNDDPVEPIHPSVSALHWEQVRPFHPQRLIDLFENQIEQGRYGKLLRSVGFAHLATRPDITAHWQHVGSLLSLDPLLLDTSLTAEDELLALGQDLALIGLNLDEQALLTALDAATLTDVELQAGAKTWAHYADPFPAWDPLNS